MDSACAPSQPKPQMSGLAIASLILSCLTVFLGPFGCLPGIVCGHLARKQIRQHPDIRGREFALAGLIVGYAYLAIVLMLILAIVFFVFLPTLGQTIGLHHP